MGGLGIWPRWSSYFFLYPQIILTDKTSQKEACWFATQINFGSDICDVVRIIVQIDSVILVQSEILKIMSRSREMALDFFLFQHHSILTLFITKSYSSRLNISKTCHTWCSAIALAYIGTERLACLNNLHGVQLGTLT